MHSNNDFLEDEARRGALRIPMVATQSFTWTSSRTIEAQEVWDYGAVLLAIAGYDLRQPLQAIRIRPAAAALPSEAWY